MPKFQTLAKCVPQKRCVRAVRSARKRTEENRRELRRVFDEKRVLDGWG